MMKLSELKNISEKEVNVYLKIDKLKKYQNNNIFIFVMSMLVPLIFKNYIPIVIEKDLRIFLFLFIIAISYFAIFLIKEIVLEIWIALLKTKLNFKKEDAKNIHYAYENSKNIKDGENLLNYICQFINDKDKIIDKEKNFYINLDKCPFYDELKRNILMFWMTNELKSMIVLNEHQINEIINEFLKKMNLEKPNNIKNLEEIQSIFIEKYKYNSTYKKINKQVI